MYIQVLLRYQSQVYLRVQFTNPIMSVAPAMTVFDSNFYQDSLTNLVTTCLRIKNEINEDIKKALVLESKILEIERNIFLLQQKMNPDPSSNNVSNSPISLSGKERGLVKPGGQTHGWISAHYVSETAGKTSGLQYNSVGYFLTFTRLSDLKNNIIQINVLTLLEMPYMNLLAYSQQLNLKKLKINLAYLQRKNHFQTVQMENAKSKNKSDLADQTSTI